MSESIGKPWINSAIINVLVQYAHELPSPALLRGRTQIAQFLTFREDTGDGSQPKDRETPLWAEISDGQCLVPARIASEAINLIEDATGKALTHYRRGFFTLKGALGYDFVPQQVTSPSGKPHIKKSSTKHVFVDITELRYISGGGPGCPVVRSGVALQTSNEIDDWERMLTVGGQTLINKQRQTKIVLEAARAAKASSKPSVATLASKRASKAPVKASAHPITPQPSIDKSAPFREWQDSIWGKRTKYVGLNHVFGPRELDIAPDQRAILEEIIEEEVKPATPEEPYDPTNTKRRLPVPNQQDELPSFRASQVISSTPLDARPSPNSPNTSHFHDFDDSEQQPPYEPASDLDDNQEEDDDSNSATPVQSPRVSNREAHLSSRIGHYRSPSVDSQAEQPDGDEESASERSVDDDEPEVLLDADDAITEGILGGTSVRKDKTASSALSNDERMPIVLAPDSDPLSQSQQRTQIRHSSPWDCESVAPSQHHDRLHSPELPEVSTSKVDRRFSPTLSSPPMKNTQPTAHPDDNQRSSASSGQGNSQESAAASLPSPPPEARNELDTVSQPANRISDESRTTAIENTMNLTQETRREQDTNSQSDPHGHQGKEASDPRPEPLQTVSRKRQRSQSQSDDLSATTPQQKTEHHSSHQHIAENKRRRLDQLRTPLDADKKMLERLNTRPPVIQKEQEGSLGASRSSNSTEPSANNAGQSVSQVVIPHDHDAWATPSWTRLHGGDQRKPETLPKPKAAGLLPLPAVADRQGKPEARQLLKPKPNVAQFNVPKVPRRAVPPNYPPVTASQVADAEEDSNPPSLPNFKVEPVTPARPIRGLASKATKDSISAQTSAVPVAPSASTGGTSTSGESQVIPPRQKIGAIAPGAAKREARSTSARPSEERHSSTRNEESQPLVTRPSKLNTGHSTKGRLDNGADVGPKSKSPARKQYLGGFQPSLLLDLDPNHTFTWNMWLEVVREADEFWQNAVENAPAITPNEPAITVRDEPVALSFPSILRNPNFAHLNVHSVNQRQAANESAISRKKEARDKDGKRRVRRIENNKFSSNPHIVQPTKRDFAIPVAQVQSTFPAPLPPYLPRTSSAPSAIRPTSDPESTLAGKFSLSLRGSRKELRRRRGRAEPLVRAVEAELCEWLAEPGKPVDTDDYVIVSGIREVRRSPGELVWDVDQDGFARYVVHCTARWYGVVSFSKEDPDGTRLTHLLRPNPTRPDRSTLATPPTTDWDTASATGFSAFATDTSEVESLAGADNESVHDDEGAELESIASEDNIPPILRVAVPGFRARSNSEAGYEHEGNESDDGWVSLHESVASLSLGAEGDPDRPMRTGRPSVIRELSRESSRSPSRRPNTRPKRRAVRPLIRAHTAPVVGQHGAKAGSLWEYLFA